MLFRQAAAGTVLMLAGLLASCSDASPGARVAHAAEVYHFSDLDVMVATSDVVVRASVISVRDGRVVAEEDEEHSLRFREVSLHVDEVLFGSVQTDALIVEEPGSRAAPLIVNGVQPSAVGDTGYYFLTLRLEPGLEGVYLLVNSQGRYLLTDNGLEGSDTEDALVKEIESWASSELEAQVVEASGKVARGEVSPLPNPCCVTPTADAA
jgi:hypothetical protein